MRLTGDIVRSVVERELRGHFSYTTLRLDEREWVRIADSLNAVVSQSTPREEWRRRRREVWMAYDILADRAQWTALAPANRQARPLPAFHPRVLIHLRERVELP